MQDPDDHKLPLHSAATGPQTLARPKVFPPWNGMAAGTFDIPYTLGLSSPFLPGPGVVLVPARRARYPGAVLWHACPRTAHRRNHPVPNCSEELVRNSRRYEIADF